MDMHNAQDLENLYGPLWKFSDYKPGQRIRYHRDALGDVTGEVLWVCAPQKVGGQHLPVHYIVESDRGGFPDIVYHTEALRDEEDSESDEASGSTMTTNTEDFAICFVYLSERMSGSGIFYAHPSCWDDHMRRNQSYRVSSELAPDGTPTQIQDGTLQLVSREELDYETMCSICQRLLKQAET